MHDEATREHEGMISTEILSDELTTLLEASDDREDADGSQQTECHDHDGTFLSNRRSIRGYEQQKTSRTFRFCQGWKSMV